MEGSIPEGLTVFDLPEPHRKRLRTTNVLERLNRKIKRRTRVATLFPNEALRLVTAMAADDGVVDAADLLAAGKFVIGATVPGNFEVSRCNLVGPEDAGVTDCDVVDLAALDCYLKGVPMPLVNQAACSVWGAP